MEKNNKGRISLKDLYLIKNFIETYSDLDIMILEVVDRMIYEKENGLNSKVTIELMEQLHFFDSELLLIIKNHGIRNMQDLLDSKLNEWDDLGELRRQELEELLVTSDLSRLEKNGEKIDSKSRYNRLLDRSKQVKKLDTKLDRELDAMLDKMASKGLLTEEIISKHCK